MCVGVWACVCMRMLLPTSGMSSNSMMIQIYLRKITRWHIPFSFNPLYLCKTKLTIIKVKYRQVFKQIFLIFVAIKWNHVISRKSEAVCKQASLNQQRQTIVNCSSEGQKNQRWIRKRAESSHKGSADKTLCYSCIWTFGETEAVSLRPFFYFFLWIMNKNYAIKTTGFYRWCPKVPCLLQKLLGHLNVFVN